MRQTALHWLKYSLLGVTAAAILGCAQESPSGPDGSEPGALATQTAADIGAERAVDLGPCDSLQVSAANKLAFRVYASGVQIYHWNGTGWSFDGPSAVLSADKEGKSTVGTHYSGPTWESVSGSKVVGAVVRRCTPDANSIAWLLLAATSSEQPGIFHDVTFIQRVNTVGGIAPANAGSFIGEQASVPYTTEYLFYRKR